MGMKKGGLVAGWKLKEGREGRGGWSEPIKGGRVGGWK